MYKSSILFFCVFLFSSCSSTQTALPNLPEMSLRVLSIRLDPEEGLSRNSTIIAELEYEVEESDEIDITDLRIVAQVATTQPGRTFDGDFPNYRYPKIKENKGRVIYTFPLRHVWNSEAATLKKPIEIDYHINYNLTRYRSIGRATTEKYVFNE